MKDAGLAGQVVGRLFDHGAVVETAPDAGVYHELSCGVADAEGDLAVPVDVDDRILHRAQPAQREAQQHRLDARRQYPSDRRGAPDPHLVQAGGDSLGSVQELCEGEAAIGGIDQHHRVGRGPHPPFKKLPETASVIDRPAIDRIGHGPSVQPCNSAARPFRHGRDDAPTPASASASGRRAVPGGGNADPALTNPGTSDPAPAIKVTPSPQVCNIFVTGFLFAAGIPCKLRDPPGLKTLSARAERV